MTFTVSAAAAAAAAPTTAPRAAGGGSPFGGGAALPGPRSGGKAGDAGYCHASVGLGPRTPRSTEKKRAWAWATVTTATALNHMRKKPSESLSTVHQGTEERFGEHQDLKKKYMRIAVIK